MDIVYIFSGVFVLIGLVIWLDKPTPAMKAKNEQDKLDGWGHVSNSRFGRDMYTCPQCGSLTVDELKKAHLDWHEELRRVVAKSTRQD